MESAEASTPAQTTDAPAETTAEIELNAAPAEPPPLPRRRSEAPAPLSVQGGLPGKVWPPVTVGDLMTRQIFTIDENEPVGDLEAGMKRFRFRHLPVVSEGKKLVGLISRTDFLHAQLGFLPSGAPLESKIDASTKASAIMRRGVVTAKLNSSVATACEVMLQEKLSCLPVILEDATLVGIITETDFTRLAGELLKATSQPAK